MALSTITKFNGSSNAINSSFTGELTQQYHNIGINNLLVKRRLQNIGNLVEPPKTKDNPTIIAIAAMFLMGITIITLSAAFIIGKLVLLLFNKNSA